MPGPPYKVSDLPQAITGQTLVSLPYRCVFCLTQIKPSLSSSGSLAYQQSRNIYRSSLWEVPSVVSFGTKIGKDQNELVTTLQVIFFGQRCFKERIYSIISAAHQNLFPSPQKATAAACELIKICHYNFCFVL